MKSNVKPSSNSVSSLLKGRVAQSTQQRTLITGPSIRISSVYARDKHLVKRDIRMQTDPRWEPDGTSQLDSDWMTEEEPCPITVLRFITVFNVRLKN